MTEGQIRRVRDSWARVVPIRARAGQIFYERLFEIDPSTIALFKGAMDLQARKLVEMLSTVVAALDDPAILGPAARDLALRHVDYGVTPEHYSSVGRALLATLHEVLGPGFGDPEATAWGSVFSDLAAEMITAAYQRMGS